MTINDIYDDGDDSDDDDNNNNNNNNNNYSFMKEHVISIEEVSC